MLCYSDVLLDVSEILLMLVNFFKLKYIIFNF